jgi:hypothetical protein
MRHLGGLVVLALLAGCHSKSQPPQAPPTSEAASPSAQPSSLPSVVPSPVATASDADPTKAAALWLDRQTEPRQKGPYAPRDACGKLPGARAFREKLAAAVLAKDADAIGAMASDNVRLGFGGDDGRRRLVARLKTSDGELMHALAQLLPLGCAPSEGGGLAIPWSFEQDYGDVDSYSAMLVTGVDVPLHAAADAGSPAKQRLSWDVLTLDKSLLPDKPFQRVTTLGGAKGYVETGKLRSMLDYRLLATRHGETWKIATLVAGD